MEQKPLAPYPPVFTMPIPIRCQQKTWTCLLLVSVLSSRQYPKFSSQDTLSVFYFTIWNTGKVVLKRYSYSEIMCGIKGLQSKKNGHLESTTMQWRQKFAWPISGNLQIKRLLWWGLGKPHICQALLPCIVPDNLPLNFQWQGRANVKGSRRPEHSKHGSIRAFPSLSSSLSYYKPLDYISKGSQQVYSLIWPCPPPKVDYHVQVQRY